MTSGIRVVQKGTTVDNAADFQVEFDSRWPLLEIYDEINVDVSMMPTAFQNFQVVSPHTLGFPPIYEWIPDETIPRFYTIASMSADYSGRILVTDKNIMATVEETFTATPGTYGAGPVRMKGVIRIYRNSPFNQFVSETLQPVAASAPADKTQGFKALRPGQRGNAMGDTEGSEFGVNTNFKSLGIHVVNHTQVGANIDFSASPPSSAFVLSIAHKSGYKPLYWSFELTFWGKTQNFPGAGSTWDGTYVDSVSFDPIIHGQVSLERYQSRAYADTVTISLDGVQSVLLGDFVTFIFHDPLQVAI